MPFLVLPLAACSATGIPGITPYKIDVQQGNVVTQDMLAKLKPGMTRTQVRYVMGTPLIMDPFHPERWDYVYLFSKHGGKPDERRVTIVFNGDTLAHIDGDVVPQKGSAAHSETPAAAEVPEATPSAAVPAATGASPAVPAGNISAPAPAGNTLPAIPSADTLPSVPAGNTSPAAPAMPPATGAGAGAQTTYPPMAGGGVFGRPPVPQ